MIEQMRRLVGRNAGRWKWLMLLEALGLAVAIPLAYLWQSFSWIKCRSPFQLGPLLRNGGLLFAVALPGVRPGAPVLAR